MKKWLPGRGVHVESVVRTRPAFINYRTDPFGDDWKETFEERLVTYTQVIEGRFVVIEQVPARICRGTGEQLFSQEVVSRIQAIVQGQRRPARILQTPVCELADAAA